MDASTVAAELGLGAEYSEWLHALEALGPPPDGVPLPSGAQAEALLRQLDVDDQDATEIMAALPVADAQPALWWLLERAYHGVVQDIGDLSAVRRMPDLPAQLGVLGRVFWVYVCMAATPEIRRWHEQKGIPDDISWATLRDLGQHIRLYRRRNDRVGFDVPWWIGLHYRGGLYALGRLQFNPYRLKIGLAGPLFWYEGADADALGEGFRPGDRAVGVHIPDTGSLDPAACDASFLAARDFFNVTLPEHACRVATCTSWLMDEQLLEYLEHESNIVRFQQRFMLVPGARDADSSPLHFVFHRRIESLDQIEPRTRLEHALVDHLKAGRHWRMRTGWLIL